MAILTVKQMAKCQPAFTEGSIRFHIFNAKDRKTSTGELIPGNGLEDAGAIIRVGGRVLIDEEKFLTWVYKQHSNEEVQNGSQSHLST